MHQQQLLFNVRRRVPLVLLLLLFGSASSALSQQSGVTSESKSYSVPLPIQSQHIDQVEHWDDLSLNSSHLISQTPILGEKSTSSTCTRELIRVQWRVNDPIDLYVMRPTNESNPPVILYLYSYPSDTDRFRSSTLCATVTAKGFAAIGFVSALTGQRYHSSSMKEWFISNLPEAIGSSVHDVQMILNYLESRGDVDMNRVGMYGQGSGGTIAILSAAIDKRIQAVDVMDPWGDWPEWLALVPQISESERSNYLKTEFLAKVAPLDPVRWMANLKNRPFRIQESIFDATIPEVVRRRILASAPSTAETALYADPKEYAAKVSSNGKMLDWLKVSLASHPLPAPSDTSSAKKATLQNP